MKPALAEASANGHEDETQRVVTLHRQPVHSMGNSYFGIENASIRNQDVNNLVGV